MKGSQADKFWAFFLQGGRCILCGEPLDISRGTFRYGGPSWEHKIPAIHGGRRVRRNLALSHRECNHLRGPNLSLKVVRPLKVEPVESGRRPLVPMNGVWYSHFRLPVTDGRWERPEQRERMLLRRLAK